MGNCAAGRTEMDGRVGFTFGNFIKRICTMAWCLTGLAAVSYFAGQQIEPDQAYGLMAREFLPNILPGLLGVFLASLLASVMSSCDSFMIASAGLFTENIYRPLLSDRSERHYVWVARIASLGIVVGGVTIAFALEDVVQGLEIFWKIAPMMGIVFWLGLFWRRTTVGGAWAGNTLGKSLDENDRIKANQTAYNSLESSPSGQVSAWRNPDSGNSGTFTPVSTFKESGKDCRTFESTITVDGRTEPATGKACRNADGTWTVVP